jgi:extracellular factor (EF) 3-hydroxypalmitic acid methyl ester biosynthesis protein
VHPLIREYCRSRNKSSVRKVLNGKLTLGEFDFVYAAGLFDYLNAPIAGALISRMCEMLKPNGKLLIAKFLTGFTDAGYMEAFMVWKLIYRTEPEMQALLGVLDEKTATNMQTFTDPINAIVYATAEKVRSI